MIESLAFIDSPSLLRLYICAVFYCIGHAEGTIEAFWSRVKHSSTFLLETLTFSLAPQQTPRIHQYTLNYHHHHDLRFHQQAFFLQRGAEINEQHHRQREARQKDWACHCRRVETHRHHGWKIHGLPWMRTWIHCGPLLPQGAA